MEHSRIHKAAELLVKMLPGGEGETTQTFYSMFKDWSRVVGEHCAAHSRPSDLKNGILYVEAEHPALIQLMQMNQKRILDSVKGLFPELKIRGLAFRVGDGRTSKATLEKAGVSEVETIEEEGESVPDSQSLEQVLDGVQDESFKAVLLSLSDTLQKTGRKRK